MIILFSLTVPVFPAKQNWKKIKTTFLAYFNVYKTSIMIHIYVYSSSILPTAL